MSERPDGDFVPLRLRHAQHLSQLLGDMERAGYTLDDQRHTIGVYRFAIGLFSGRYRCCGKPFLNHLVGTAALLVAMRLPVAAVTAGLLHAAYEQGDFGWPMGLSRTWRRYRLRNAVGSAAEALVAGYTDLRWTSDRIAALPESWDRLSDFDRTLALLRLANDLDDFLERGCLHCSNQSRRLEYLRRNGRHLVAIADRAGQPELAALLDETIADCIANPPDSSLIARQPDFSYSSPANSDLTLPLGGWPERLRRRIRRGRRLHRLASRLRAWAGTPRKYD